MDDEIVMDELEKFPPWKQLYDVVQTWEDGQIHIHKAVAKIMGMELPKDNLTYYRSVIRVRKELLKTHGLDLINEKGSGYFVDKIKHRNVRTNNKVKQAGGRIGRAKDLVDLLPADTPDWAKVGFYSQSERLNWLIKQMNKTRKDINKIAIEHPRLQLSTNGTTSEHNIKEV